MRLRRQRTMRPPCCSSTYEYSSRSIFPVPETMEMTGGGGGGSRLRIFSGTANPRLAQETACYLGMELGKIRIKRFADGEIYVQLQESVRGCNVFLVQPTCPPANENLMELLVMIDACRQEHHRSHPLLRVRQGRESIAAKLVANLLTHTAFHSGQSIGYFDIPVDHVHGQQDHLPRRRGGGVAGRGRGWPLPGGHRHQHRARRAPELPPAHRPLRRQSPRRVTTIAPSAASSSDSSVLGFVFYSMLSHRPCIHSQMEPRSFCFTTTYHHTS